MTASRPDNEAIFHAARDIPDPDRRREYVREACGGDEARIAHIEALLAAADGPDSLLDRPAAGTPVATIDQPTTESPGTVIGPYKLIEQIGEGGMGSVWMAQQTEPVKRLVAVKLIKAGMDSRQVIARFEAERQALALMDHPNIARVLDGGTTSGGRPYFVMDLVKGVPITRYCDEHHLTPRQRLELFIPVCQAVQHAHQKGIIHRDLKPSNVLVALYDGKPVPKIIDFGVAKAAGQQLTDKTLVTGFGAIVGTLEYMSPEQAEVNQLDIDTRSDIYSLGVLLYELLTGSPPFSRKELTQAGMLEMLRVIREQEPIETEHEAEHGGRLADVGRQPRDGTGEADEAGAWRTGLDRDEGAGEGPQPPLRDGQRLRDGRAALPGRRAGAGLSAVGGVPAAQVRPAKQGRAGGGRAGAVLPRASGQRRRLGGAGSVGAGGGSGPAAGGAAGEGGRGGRVDLWRGGPAGEGAEVAGGPGGGPAGRGGRGRRRGRPGDRRAGPPAAEGP